MATVYLKNKTTGEIIGVDKPSAHYDELTTDAVNAGVSGRNVPLTNAAQWDEVSIGSGGSSAQVFEVTNLTIPAGTDWSGGSADIGAETGPMVLGTLPFRTGQVVSYALQIEAAELPSASDDVAIYVLEGDLAWPGGIIAGSGVGFASYAWNGNGATITVGSTTAGPGGPVDYAALATALDWNVVLRTENGPISADVHITRARAAFLVI